MSPSIADIAAAMDRVRETFAAYQESRRRFNLCRRPESIETARRAMVLAEREYSEAAKRRDDLVKEAHAKVTP